MKPTFMLWACSAIASPTPTRPAVHIRNGTVIGFTDDQLDNFYGIPFVQPPVKSLRLRPPQSIDKTFGTLSLVKNITEVAACIQMDQDAYDTTGVPQEAVQALDRIGGNFTGLSGEDCLTINVQRPSHIPAGKKLPVLFWIYGGGWELGATQSYDASALVQKSIAMGEPMIFVAANYRINAFGFLQGRQMQEAGATNLGLRDQRKALEWVAENIASFGGDPDKVTIWGESAGSASVNDQLIINNGDHTYRGKPLFHGAIMNSGAIIHTLNATNAKAQRVFDEVAAAVGCSTVDCLRNVPVQNFTAAMNAQPNFSSSQGNNLAYIRRTDSSNSFYSNYPEDAFAAGKFAHVPIIAGNMQDEATPFAITSRHLVNSTSTLIDYIASWLPETPRKLVTELIDTYPDNPAAGLPTDTGSEWELYPQYKRNAAVQTDLTFNAGRRQFLSAVASRVPSWSYLATYLHGFPLLGTYHTADLGTQFGLQQPVAADHMNEAYIKFVNHGDPNGCDKPWWPRWDKKTLQMANFSATGVGLTHDNFRWDSIDFWRRHGSMMRM